MNKKKLSIITINYNNKIGLEKTIKSVVNQTYKNFEYLIIDGESTDGSKEVIEVNSQNIDYWISEKDSGVYNAMNKGIKIAKGEYLLFLNSGDFLIDESVLQKIIIELKNDVSIYYGNILYSKNETPTFLNTPPSELSFSFFLQYSLPHPASFIKKKLFEKYFYYNETLKIVSDWEFFIFCICKQNESYKHIDILVSNFDNSGISSNLSNTQTIFNEKEFVLKKHFPLFFNDLEYLLEIKSKRFQQIIAIKENKIKWNVLKFLINLLSVFTPKSKSVFSKIYSKINNFLNGFLISRTILYGL
jgi:glycosyltransferase involved in cell wall biosynthesis